MDSPKLTQRRTGKSSWKKVKEKLLKKQGALPSKHQRRQSTFHHAVKPPTPSPPPSPECIVIPTVVVEDDTDSDDDDITEITEEPLTFDRSCSPLPGGSYALHLLIKRQHLKRRKASKPIDPEILSVVSPTPDVDGVCDVEVEPWQTETVSVTEPDKMADKMVDEAADQMADTMMDDETEQTTPEVDPPADAAPAPEEEEEEGPFRSKHAKEICKRMFGREDPLFMAREQKGKRPASSYNPREMASVREIRARLNLPASAVTESRGKRA